jgi:hypothetical protein
VLEPEPPLSVGMRLGVGMLFGVSPAALPGGRAQLYVSVAGSSVWAPELSLGYGYHRRDGWKVDGGLASFALHSLTATACPLRFGGQVVGLRPCLVAEEGRLITEGRETFGARRTPRPWRSLGLELVVRARLPSFDLGASVRGAHPWIRDGYFFDPDPTFHRASALTWDAGVSVGYRFR